MGRDWALAKKWYERAAAQKHRSAMTCVGALLKTGGHGVARNEEAAVECFRKGANAGCSFGQYNVCATSFALLCFASL